MSFRKIVINYWFYLYCLSGFFVMVAAWYPGILSYDSIQQYEQSLTGQYTDWHPPIMAAFWRLLHFINKGPQTLLYVQLGLYWGSFAVLFSTSKRILWRAVIFLFSISPFVLNFSGYIIKDSEMGLTWMLACSILLRAWLNNKHLTFTVSIIIFVLLTYGCWVRINAFTAVIPLCILFSWLLFPGKSFKYKLISVFIFSVWMISGRPIQKLLFHPKHTFPENKLFLHDLTGVYARTGYCGFPKLLLDQKFDTAFVRKNYHPATYDEIIKSDDSINVMPEDCPLINKALEKEWLKAIKLHPRAYLQHRYECFLYFLRIKKRLPDYYPYYFDMEPNCDGIEYNETIIGDAFQQYITWFTTAWFMLPWFWFFLNIAMLSFVFFIKDSKRKMLFSCLVISGLLYTLSQFFITPIDTDFRYFYWECITCSLSVCSLIFRKAKI